MTPSLLLRDTEARVVLSAQRGKQTPGASYNIEQMPVECQSGHKARVLTTPRLALAGAGATTPRVLRLGKG